LKADIRYYYIFFPAIESRHTVLL